MGCWNQTCGLTQIHIRAGERVMIFPLAEASIRGMHYSTPFYTPLAVPFYGEYNDYGAAEECDGIGLHLALDLIKDKLVEIEQGNNQYHDIAVKKEEFNEDLFWEAIHEERLRITGWRGEETHAVGIVMLKQSVFDHLAANLVFQDYDYDRTIGMATYFDYKLQDVLDGVPEFVDAMLTPRFKIPAGLDEELAKELKDFMSFVEPISSVARKLLSDENGEVKLIKDGINRAASWLKYFGSHLSDGFSVTDQMNTWSSDLVKAADRDGLIELITEHLKMKFVDKFFMMTRKVWSIQTGMGSQSDDHSGYQALVAAMSHVLAEEKARWDEEDE